MQVDLYGLGSDSPFETFPIIAGAAIATAGVAPALLAGRNSPSFNRTSRSGQGLES